MSQIVFDVIDFSNILLCTTWRSSAYIKLFNDAWMYMDTYYRFYVASMRNLYDYYNHIL